MLRRIVANELHKRQVKIRVCLICAGGEIADELDSHGIPVDIIGSSRSIYNPLTFLSLARYLKSHSPTIVQSSQFNSNFHTRIAARIARIQLVICEEHGVNSWKQWWHRWIDRILVKWCDGIIAVSEAVKKFNVNTTGISAEKIFVMHNCLDLERSKSRMDRAQVRRDLGIGPDECVVGHVGTLRREKGHDLLLRAHASIQKRRASKLLMVGDGPIKQELHELAEELGIVDSVIFAGQRLDVPDLLQSMDIFAFPSRNEALGIALLEAMLNGLPVVATQVGGIPEIVKDNDTGVLIPAEDSEALAEAIVRLSTNPKERFRLGCAAKKYVKRYHDPATYVDSLLSLHSYLLRNKGRA